MRWCRSTMVLVALTVAAVAGQASAAPPGRGYEQVSPVEKRGVSVDSLTTVQSTADGNGVAYSAPGAFANSPTGLIGTYYLGRRSADGWSTDPMDGPQENTIPVLQTANPSLFLASDLSSVVQFSQRALAPGAIEGGANLYRRDNVTGARRLLLAARGQTLAAELVTYAFKLLISGTPDASHVVFNATQALVPDAPVGVKNAYELTDAGVRLVNRLPDGSIDPGGGTVQAPDFTRTSRPVSADGERIYFVSPAGNSGALYLRTGGSTTRAISVSRIPGDPTTPVPAKFSGASSDGSVVYFVSTALTPDAVGTGDFLYRYEVESDTLTNLTVLRDPTDSVVAVRRVSHISADGESVYFTAWANLAPGGVSFASNFYVWRDGQVKLAATVATSEIGPPNSALSPNGRFLAFTSTGQPTGFDNAGSACGGACVEVYRYDAETERLDCLSCNLTGTGNQVSDLQPQSTSISDYTSRAVLDDGRVFYTSRERLVPEDINGRNDVYQWQDGVNSLISPGWAAHDAVFAEASADGSDVFFTTTERIVRQDTDSAIDLYDARVGGGIAAQNRDPDAVAICVGDGCRPGMIPPPTVQRPGSGDVVGDGNAEPTPPARVVPRVTLTAQRSARGSRFTIKVTTTTRGRITISGTGIRRLSPRVRGAATRTYRVALTRKARKALIRKGTYRARLLVRFVPSSGRASSKRVVVTLKPR